MLSRIVGTPPIPIYRVLLLGFLKLELNIPHTQLFPNLKKIFDCKAPLPHRKSIDTHILTVYYVPMLRDIREEHGLSMQKLADLAGMSEQAIYRYEQGVYMYPSIMYISALSKLTDTPSQDLIATYNARRKSNRASFKSRIDRIPERKLTEMLEQSRQPELHPFKRFRGHLLLALNERPSDMNFSVLTSFHPAQLHRYENTRGVVNLPASLAILFPEWVVKEIATQVSQYWKNQ